jgi:hypothetical protein
MSCVSDSCNQGRDPCPTPWLCGLYKADNPETVAAPANPINAIYRQYLDATENDASPTSPVDAMSWPYLLLLGVVTAVILGSACAWAITNWQLLELAALDFWN